MAITIAGFRAIFPQFSAVPDSTVQFYLDLAVKQVGKARWEACNLYEEGVYWLAAHYIQLSIDAENGGGTVSGPASSKRVGDVQVSYQTFNIDGMTTLDMFYESTIYGRTFLAWMRLVGVGAVVVC